ncbi:hypothetical protein NJBCHELONAE_47130 [Mycobacteroides chelonae]|nr:hypothetical protein NJBCHELONAE_47130 [Mycobacteroides chelonae]
MVRRTITVRVPHHIVEQPVTVEIQAHRVHDSIAVQISVGWYVPGGDAPVPGTKAVIHTRYEAAAAPRVPPSWGMWITTETETALIPVHIT